ncbi:bifunctional 4-hydroxy-2-oxoglutarate aldolase/2-dehydro-3-deoxy-phosphogluconate aldolase [Salinibacterium sp. TMP30]|uniref:bifunctional 4-hydroxy-2-oxoglutarate aldolase/2-dehydro-3-deoxy-phosphogluconate aldolase n=1 Tax=Salinibacterium sp. TMP30 TaxID=3138237 RepID=UPI003139D74D
MAILRGFTPERTSELASAAWTAGFHLVEVPLQGPLSARALQGVSNSGTGVIGAGSILSTDLVDQAARLGAVFTVSPGFDEKVAAYSLSVGLPHLPGVATPTEVQRAMSAGFTWLKAFPAAVLGHEWFSAMLGPFPDVRLVATGGVTSENFEQLLDAGASAVSFGTSFTSMETSALERLQ